MSSDTRLYPEDHEPKAIKIRHPKHTKRNIIIAVICAVLIIGLGAAAWVFFAGAELPKLPFGSTESESSAASESESSEESESLPESSSVPESSAPALPSSSVPESSVSEVSSEPEPPAEPEPDPIPKDEWYMLLVNKEHPLTADFTVATKAIDSEGHTVDERIYDDLSAMLTAAKAAGYDLRISTAYRSYNRQQQLYDAGSSTAAAGTSEHNSGLAVDILTVNGEFEGSAAEAWLLEHAEEYGFILRYPKDKEAVTGFAYEPWHFRYVGKEQAKLINESGLCLEEYLAQ